MTPPSAVRALRTNILDFFAILLLLAIFEVCGRRPKGSFTDIWSRHHVILNHEDDAAPDYVMKSTTPDAHSLTEKWPDIMRSWTTLCNQRLQKLRQMFVDHQSYTIH